MNSVIASPVSVAGANDGAVTGYEDLRGKLWEHRGCTTAWAWSCFSVRE